MSVGVADRPVVRRILGSGTTTPERLRRIEVLLVLACLLYGVLGVVGGTARSHAVHDGRVRVAALTTAVAELYQSLADADAAATTGYVSGGREPDAVRARYDADVERAGDRLVGAAGLLPQDDPGLAAISTIGEQLPVYSSLIENARSLNRQGLPLGQSYLGSASKLMRTTILPAVEDVRARESATLATVYRDGAAVPFAVLAVGIALLLALIDLALGERRRTHRVLNAGLVAAGAAVLISVVWWGVAVVTADARLDGSQGHSDAGAALDDTRIAVLQARSNESLVLVARNSGGGSSDKAFTDQLQRVLADDGLLAAAGRADAGVAGQVAALRAATTAWGDAHRGVRGLDDGGRYPQAVASVVGRGPGTSGGAFEALDGQLAGAIDGERAAFTTDMAAADSAVAPLGSMSGLLALLAAGAVVAGIGQRVGEYR